MTDPVRTPEERADAYLDGDLPRGEALAFERDLIRDPSVAEALAAALALREVLGTLPPLAPPPGLTDRIARRLPLARAPASREDAGRTPSPALAVLHGLGWTLRGTALAAFGTTQVRWSLGPLGAPAEPVRRPALWRRLLLRRRESA